jgi:hypothetical protein
MDLKAYYHRIRELERSFDGDHAVVVSLETADGGKAGVKTEVPVQVAAKMIVEGRARVASEQEVKEFHERKSEAKRAIDQMDASKRMQVTVVSENDLRASKGPKGSGRQ